MRVAENIAKFDIPQKKNSRVAVLGAGNLNDIDLTFLLTKFDEVVAVDWDVEAVAAGIDRQRSFAESAGTEWDRVSVAPAIDLANSESQPFLDLGTFDGVLSVGLLSQLIEQCLETNRSADSTKVAEQLRVTRECHLNQVLRILRPLGHALVTTEVVGSDTLPELSTTSDADLPPLLFHAMTRGNFFSGLQPTAVLDSAQRISSRFGRRVDPLPPWIWDLGPRIYAVVAYAFRPLTTAHSPSGERR